MLIRRIDRRVRKPGLIDMPAQAYHADPAPEPSLNQSTIKVLLEQTPSHARWQHPRLNPIYEPETSRRMELGSAVHEILAGKGRGIVVVPFRDYRTDAARTARDDALAAGKTPVLMHDIELAHTVADAVRKKLARTPGAERAFAGNVGHGEVVAIWKDRAGIWGRTMIDWCGPTEIDLWDLKTTSTSIDDEAIARKIDDGLAIQAAWILRGMGTLFPHLARHFRMRFVIVEIAPPYASRVFEIPDDTLEGAARDCQIAAVTWRECLERRWWPSYENRIETLGPTPWHEGKRALREERQPFAWQALSEDRKTVSRETPAAPEIDPTRLLSAG